MKQIVVHCRDGLTEVALIEDRMLVEFFAERPLKKQRVGSVYIGKVVNVLPGMQAAFVDIGLKKNAFLHVDDVLPANLERVPAEKPSIDALLKEGQELIVQMAKEPLGSKGARVTTHISLPGRWIVYMPEADYVGVSRKIESAAERERLRDMAERLRRPGEGLIMRTIAEDEGWEAVEKDLDHLRNEWQRILSRAKESTAPAELYREPGVLGRMVRDMFTEQVDELVVDDANQASEIAALIRGLSPGLENRVKVYAGSEPIYDRCGIREQLARLLGRKIPLESGGYLVVDRTEALTVVDVNTGKYTGVENLEDTVFRTNLEAAEQIGRLLRLRDWGGIVLVDFIDMASDEHRAAVAERLARVLSKDRTKATIVGWTRLGLLEITRKKVRESLDDVWYAHCPTCGGSGKVRSELHLHTVTARKPVG